MTSPARLILKPRRAQPFFYRHPWVFEGAVAKTEGDPQLGDEAVLVGDRGDEIARGLFNPNSNIKLRLYSWEAGQLLDDAFFIQKLEEAIALRRSLFPTANERAAFRVINSEGDGLSGLTVDRYGDWLVVQLTSAALSTRWEVLLDQLRRLLAPKGILLRGEKGIADAEGMAVEDELAWGEPPPRPLTISEHGLEYEVDLTAGQKTGFFLDQRDNRFAVSRYTAGHRVLDLFCYSGGFGLTAIREGGAKSVLGVDASPAAIELATANATRNGLQNEVTYRTGAAFETLESLVAAQVKFDTVILDPPKMTRNRSSVEQALKGYHSLNRLAVDLLPPGGLLVTCSCSGLISRGDFEGMLAAVAMRANRHIQILESRGPAADHPVSVACPESYYLKCYICRVV